MLVRLAILVAGLLMPGIAQAEWRRATSDHFIVYSDGSEEALRRFTAKVEAFDSLLRLVAMAKGTATSNRLEIYLLRDARSIQRMLGKGGRNVAGLYSSKLAGAIAVVPRSDGGGGKYDLDGETVLFHEYAHHFMMQYFATAYPPWYVEGFAEYYSTAEMNEDGTASIGKPAYHRAYGLSLLSPFPVERLLSAKPNARNSAETEAFYGRAWLLTHMISFSDERGVQLGAYLKAYAAGTDPQKAAVDAFGPLPALNKDLTRYAGAKRMSYRKLSGIKWTPSSIAIAPLDPAENALIVERLNWKLGIDEREKADFLSAVRTQAARFPSSIFALDLLADAELLAGNDAAASAADERLLALKPAYGPALLRKAEAMAGEIGNGDDAQAQWKAVRSLIIKANRANTEDPVALYRYYVSFGREGIKPTKSAIEGLLKSYELAPQADEVRLTLGARLIEENRSAEARNVLKPLAFAPHGGDGATAARTMLAALDGEKPTAAPPATQPGEQQSAPQ